MADRETVFSALGSEIRLSMLELIAAHKEMCGCELVDHFEMAQSAISAHLQKLKAAGLVRDRRDGFRVFYRVVPEAMEAAFDELRASLARNLERGRKQDPLARVERRLAQPKTA
jgi:DNA-binding transcriptional ArsR family regulator